MEILEEAISGLEGKQIPGDVVFKLYDTYGFPVDLTADVARERGLTIDQAGFEAAMEGQREKAKACQQVWIAHRAASLKVDAETEFTGYDGTDSVCEIVAVQDRQRSILLILAGDERAQSSCRRRRFTRKAADRLATRAFLAEEGRIFRVDDTQKSGKANVHFGAVEEGEFKVGDKLEAIVDAERRQAIRPESLGTHLMHAALRRCSATT